MKTSRLKQRGNRAFTLIEMIGVLAVIAILAALLIPKIFEAINNARVNNAAVSYNTVKSAMADHYAKYGTLLSSNGAVLTAGSGPAMVFDRVLVMEGFLDKPFNVKIGDGVTNHVEIVAGLATNTAPNAVNSAYDLDGVVTPNDAGPVGTAVVQAVISSVTPNDAKDLNDRLDGPTLGTALPNDDFVGRVKYGAPVGGLTDVYIYI